MVRGKVSEGFTQYLIDARKELLPLPSSTPELLNALSVRFFFFSLFSFSDYNYNSMFQLYVLLVIGIRDCFI